MYRVVGWSERYETSESRKRRRLDWVAVPNQWDSRAYLAIVKLPDGAAILGAWMLILEVASRTPERGLLAEDGIALTAEDIAAKVRIPVKVISRALDVLSSPLIGWLESAATPADHAATPADDAATPADHAGLPVLPNHTLPNHTLPDKTGAARPSPAEVTAYSEEIGKPIDGAAFCDFYASKGWKVGGQAMKDWKAAARNWYRRQLAESAGGQHHQHTSSQAARGRTAADYEAVIYGAKEERP